MVSAFERIRHMRPHGRSVAPRLAGEQDADGEHRSGLLPFPSPSTGAGVMRYLALLRYPVGKAGLAGFLADVLDLNDLRGCSYYEPDAGGAGAALGLLKKGVVSDCYVNDADPRVHAFWVAARNESER